MERKTITSRTPPSLQTSRTPPTLQSSRKPPSTRTPPSNQNLALHYEIERIDRRIVQLTKDIFTAFRLCKEGAGLLGDMREAASQLEKGRTDGLPLLKYWKVIIRPASPTVTARIADKLYKASAGQERRCILAKAFRDMAKSLETFATHAHKEHICAEKYADDIKEVAERNKAVGQKCAPEERYRFKERKILLDDLRVHTTHLDKMVAICRRIAETKARREPTAKIDGNQGVGQQQRVEDA